MTEIKEFQGGELLVVGATDWGHIGRTLAKGKKQDPKEVERASYYPNLDVPHRVKSLMGVKIKMVASGSAACHSIIADIEGRCYTWGRNEKGQLGHGDLTQRNMPTLVEGLEGKNIIAAAAGKNHSVVVTDDGKCWAFGSNQYGQLGTGMVLPLPNLPLPLAQSRFSLGIHPPPPCQHCVCRSLPPRPFHCSS